MNEPKPLPSETKLVDTPRTDAACDDAATVGGIPSMYGYMVEFARQLERELDECQQWRLGPNGVKWYIERTEKAESALASLADELRLAREDAKRYRWLRANHRSDVKHRLVWYLPRSESLDAEGLDAAIDAALKAGC